MATPKRQFRFGQYHFHFRIGFTLLSLFFVILFCVLGVWQFQRYHFKKNLLATYDSRLKSIPKNLIPFSGSPDQWQFQHVIVQGTLDNAATMLVQNQLHEGQMGYEVLTPLKISGEKRLLLVDRGWIASNKLDSLPKIDANPKTLTGYIKLATESQFMLGKNIYDTQKIPLVMQKIDINELSGITQQSFFPFVLRLQTDLHDGLTQNWIISTVMPERHLGYTIQWFLMAIVLIIAYLCFCCEKIKK
jgi:surfeit locus 1 family protein